MAGAETSGSNPDVGLLYDVNGLAGDAPHWVDSAVEFLGEYGLLLGMVALVLTCWWTQRRQAGSLDAAAASAAAAIWAPLAAGIAVLVNVPIRDFVARPRPFLDHEGLHVLVRGKDDFSFVSDHATLAMALAAGLFVASRKYGLIGIVMALAEGFCRVFMGVHYPTDVVGGFALGTAVALLLSPLATAALTPLTRAMGRSSHAGWLIAPRRDLDDHAGQADGADGSADVRPCGRDGADTRGAGSGDDDVDRAGRRRGWRFGAAGATGAGVRAGRPESAATVTAAAGAAGAGTGKGARASAGVPGSSAAESPGSPGAADASGTNGAHKGREGRGRRGRIRRQGGGRAAREARETCETEPEQRDTTATGGQDPTGPTGPRDPQGPREPDLAA